MAGVEPFLGQRVLPGRYEGVAVALEEVDLDAVEDEAEEEAQEEEEVGVEDGAREIHAGVDGLLVGVVANHTPGGEEGDEVDEAQQGEGVDAEAGAVVEAEEADSDEGGGGGEEEVEQGGGGAIEDEAKEEGGDGEQGHHEAGERSEEEEKGDNDDGGGDVGEAPGGGVMDRWGWR